MPRKKKPNGKVADCTYCEGLKIHWGKKCIACDGTGRKDVQKKIDSCNNLKMKVKNENRN